MGLFSAIGDVVGGIIGNNSADDQQNEANYFSSKEAEKDRWFQRDMAEWQWKRQKLANQTFAGNQMTDLIDTGRQHGLHALASIGAPSSGYTPVQSFGGSSPMGQTSGGGSSGLIGSGIGEALDSLLNNKERKEDQRLDREYKQAQTELLRAQSRTAISLAERAGRDIPTSEQNTGNSGSENEKRVAQDVDPGRQTVTQPEIRKDGLPAVHPGHLDAESAQARRGNIAEEIAGARNSIHDSRWNKAMDRLVKTFGKEGAQRIVNKHWGDFEYIIKLSKGKGTRQPQQKPNPHFK